MFCCTLNTYKSEQLLQLSFLAFLNTVRYLSLDPFTTALTNPWRKRQNGDGVHVGRSFCSKPLCLSASRILEIQWTNANASEGFDWPAASAAVASEGSFRNTTQLDRNLCFLRSDQAFCWNRLVWSKMQACTYIHYYFPIEKHNWRFAIRPVMWPVLFNVTAFERTFCLMTTESGKNENQWGPGFTT